MDVSRLGVMALWIAGAVLSGGELPRSAQAQPQPRVEARVSADTVRIGERFRLTLVAEHAAEAAVQFPAPNAGPSRFGALEVLGRAAAGTRPVGEGRAVDSVAYEVTTFALDRVRVPSLPVRIVAGGDTTTAATAPRLVPVASVVGPNANGLREGDPLAPFPRPIWPWLLWGALGAALVAGGAYWWWRRPPSEDDPPDPTSSDATPHETAHTRLRTLAKTADLEDRSALKPFYVELADILRTYLADELDVAAREHTTREVVAALRHQHDLPDEAIKRVEAVLERADLVKFAGVRPSAKATKETYRWTREAIDALQAAADSIPVDGVAAAKTETR